MEASKWAKHLFRFFYYPIHTTKKIAISDGQRLSQQHKTPSQIRSADGKRPSTSVGKSLVDNTILPTRPSLTLIFDRKKLSLAIHFFHRKYFFIRGSWTTKYILWWTKAVVNVFFRHLKVIINIRFVVENTTSYEEVGWPNIFCDELRPSLMYFFDD